VKKLIRRYNLSNGDNAPAYAHFKIMGVWGSGIVHVDLGWAPCSVQISPARQLLRVWKGDYLKHIAESYGIPESYSQYSDSDEFQAYVKHENGLTESGFFLQFRNAPGIVDINYLAI